MRFAIRDHMTEPLDLLLPEGFILLIAELRIRLHMINKIPCGLNILMPKQQNTIGVLTVATGTTSLLIIALEILRHIVVDNKAYIGFVDSHTESVGRDHDLLAVVDEIILILAAFLITQPRMIARCGKALFAQQSADLLHSFACRAIDDPRVVHSGEQKVQKLLGLLRGTYH